MDPGPHLSETKRKYFGKNKKRKQSQTQPLQNPSLKGRDVSYSLKKKLIVCLKISNFFFTISIHFPQPSSVLRETHGSRKHCLLCVDPWSRMECGRGRTVTFIKCQLYARHPLGILSTLCSPTTPQKNTGWKKVLSNSETKDIWLEIAGLMLSIVWQE